MRSVFFTSSPAFGSRSEIGLELGGEGRGLVPRRATAFCSSTLSRTRAYFVEVSELWPPA